MESDGVCSICGAANRSGAAWCQRCQTPLGPRAVAPGSPAASDGPAAAPDGSSRRRVLAWVLALLVVVATAARVVASAGSDVVLGSDDPRGFRFTRIDSSTGEPVRFNPCAPVHYVVNPASAPEGAIDDIHATFEKTTQASGVRFVFDGTTDELPSVERDLYQPDRYGHRWAPVLVAWVSELPDITGRPEVDDRERIGVGGSALVDSGAGPPVLVTGMAIFDADAELEPGFGGNTWGQAMLHEVGHIMGLDHVEVADSVMNPLIGLRPAAWSEGDRAGLWELGLGSTCIRVPDAH